MIYLPSLLLLCICFLLCLRIAKPGKKHMAAVLCAMGAFLGFAMALSHAPSSGVIRLDYTNSGIIMLFAATLGAFICLCLPPYRKDEKHGLSCRISALLTALFSLLFFLHLYMMSGID